MPLSSLLWMFLAFTFSGSGVAQTVIQDQPDISGQLGQSVTLNCQYRVTLSYFYMFWYKLLPNGEMIYLIGQVSTGQNTRDGRYSVNFQKARKSISLTISDLELEDSAEYFCALWELTVLEVMGKAKQKPQGLIKESFPAAEPQLKYAPAYPRPEMVLCQLGYNQKSRTTVIQNKRLILRNRTLRQLLELVEEFIQSCYLAFGAEPEFTLNQLECHLERKIGYGQKHGKTDI
ncbi:uncharacterized protein LOC133067021 [Dama dama]|uniref:uncharacterized protein LOC133067021 n=1 Tax=Dama dama TaxID=30532 RepID=UPI002A35EE87|nr:uncharacterized protein LOC133067021 [Dama dama]